MGNETRKETLSNQTRRENIIPQTGEVQYSNSKYHELLAPIIPQGYSVLELLSTAGGESDVYLIANGPHKEVIKLYRQGIDIKEATLQELKSLSEEYPEHLVKIYEVGYHTEAGRWYERMEYIPFGNLRDFFPYGYGGKKLLDAVFDELKSALVVLHNNNLIHRDLKPENIMVRTKHPLDLVFADFGMSSSLDSNLSRKMTMTVGGTFDYMAPESFMSVDGQTITGKGVDIWALGIIIYEMITGQTPFAGINPMMIGHKLITEGVIIDEEVIPVEFHDYIANLTNYLSKEPNERSLTPHNDKEMESFLRRVESTLNQLDRMGFIDLKENKDNLDITEEEALHQKSIGYREQGKYEEALGLAFQVVERSKVLNGEDNLITVRYMSNLGRILYLMKKYKESEEILYFVYDVRKLKLGEDDELTKKVKDRLEDINNSNTEAVYSKNISDLVEFCETLDFNKKSDIIDDFNTEPWSNLKQKICSNSDELKKLLSKDIPSVNFLLGLYFRNGWDNNFDMGSEFSDWDNKNVKDYSLGIDLIRSSAETNYFPAKEWTKYVRSSL